MANINAEVVFDQYIFKVFGQCRIVFSQQNSHLSSFPSRLNHLAGFFVHLDDDHPAVFL